VGDTGKLLIGFVQMSLVTLQACGGVQPFPNHLVAWQLVVTLQIAMKAEFKQPLAD